MDHNAAGKESAASRRRAAAGVAKDALLTAVTLAIAVLLCFTLRQFDEGDTYVGLLFVLAVTVISRWTDGYFWGIFSSFFGVVCVNYVFTYPYWAINFTMTGYPITFVTLLAVSVIISTMTTIIKRQDRLRLEADREAIRANLLRAMSHDIRTPLTSIVGNASVMLEDQGLLSDEQKRSLLLDINEDAQWLVRMVENILSITRIRGGTDALATEYETPEDAIGEAVRKFSRRFPNIALSVEVPDVVMLIPMDITLIQQVLMNLMENAAIHGRASAIFLTVEKTANGARFAIRDNGCGISPKLLPTIFEAQLSGDPRDADGKKNMGIGLSVCYSIVQAHGGSMTARNLPDGGAEFAFTLPVTEEIEDE